MLLDWIIVILFNALAIWLGARLLRGVEVEDFPRAIIVAIFVAILNATIGEILHFLTYPLRFLTLGLIILVVNAAVLMIADYFMKGLKIQNFWYAVALSLIVSVANGIADWFT